MQGTIGQLLQVASGWRPGILWSRHRKAWSKIKYKPNISKRRYISLRFQDPNRTQTITGYASVWNKIIILVWSLFVLYTFLITVPELDLISCYLSGPLKPDVNINYRRSVDQVKDFINVNGYIQFGGSGMFIPDLNFFHPGSKVKEFIQKIVSKLSEIRTLIFYSSRIPGPGSRGQKGTGSRIRIRNTC